jgi:hypothetical protein
VLEVLDSAGAAYTSKSGFQGKMKKIAEYLGDKADTIQQMSRIVPDIDYSRPIIGALVFLLEVSPLHITHCYEYQGYEGLIWPALE